MGFKIQRIITGGNEMLHGSDVAIAIQTHPDIADIVKQFKKVVRPGWVHYRHIILSSTSGIGGENDIHFDWHRQDIEVVRFGLRLRIYGNKVTHNGTFRCEWLNLRLLAKYKAEITQALELAPQLFRERGKAIDRKMASKSKKKKNHIIAIMKKYGDKFGHP